MVSRGLKTSEDWEKVAEFFHRSVLLVSKFQEKYGKLLKDFKNAEKELDDSSSELYELKEQVIEFSNKFTFINYVYFLITSPTLLLFPCALNALSLWILCNTCIPWTL